MITTDQDQRQNILPTKTDSPDKLYNLSLVYSIAGGDEGFVKRMLQLVSRYHAFDITGNAKRNIPAELGAGG